MPHIRQVPRKGAPRWEATWYDPQGKKRWKLFPSQIDAEQFINETPHRIGLSGVDRGPVGEPLDQRIRRLSKTDANGCWIWQGRIMNAGYGQIGISTGVSKQRTTGAHRVSYEAFVGPIPDGLVIDHLCRVRACVNPDHLDVVKQRENVMRSPVALGALNAAKTHCPQGHEYSPENTYIYRPKNRSFVGRQCRTCVSDYRRRRSASKQAAAKAVAR